MILALTFVIVIRLIVIWRGPKIQIKNQKLKRVDKAQVIDLENKLRQTYSQIIGGLVVIIGFYISYNNFVSIKFKQNTEILSNCLNQLTDSSQTIRIGSIYTLSKLASNSEEDKKIVLEILCDFLSNDSTGSRSKKETTLALKIIANTPKMISSENDRLFIYNTLFYNLVLSDLNFSEVNFPQCKFQNCFISSSSFKNSSLSDSEFYQCLMRTTNFNKVRAVNIRFLSCDLSDSDFSNAQLNSALFSDCHLEKVNFYKSLFGPSFTPKHLGSFNNFLKDTINYSKTRIEKSDLTGVISLKRDTAKIILINNRE